MPAASEDIYKRTGAAVRALRHKLGHTQTALAERAGISVSFVSYLESGRKKGSLETYHKLAAALGVGLSTLFRAIPSDGAKPRKYGLVIPGLTAAERRAIYRLVSVLRGGKKT